LIKIINILKDEDSDYFFHSNDKID